MKSNIHDANIYWEHYDHGSDIGVRGIGNTRESAFEQAALALTAVVTDPEEVRPVQQVRVDCDGSDDELLFVDWLNLIIYEMATQRMLFGRFNLSFGENGLSGQLWGELMDVERHQPAVEIKGATFTTLSVAQDDNDRWVAQTVVDV